MGRYKNSGLAHGTQGSPQISIEQSDYKNKIEKLLQKVKENDDLNQMVKPLEELGVKFTKEDVLFVTKDKIGQIVWLEKNNEYRGLKHILDGDGFREHPGHADQFKKAFNVNREQLPAFLNEFMTKGNIYSNQLKNINGRQGYERVYEYKGDYVIVTGIGTNGFIVTARPGKKLGVKKMESVKIMFDYLHGPIWCCDEDGILYIEHFDVIKNDNVCRKLNEEAENMYSSYYEFDSHDLGCWFNYVQQFKDRFIMRDLLQKLVNRLNEINDGSYIVEPLALDEYNKLCSKDTFEDLNQKNNVNQI